MSAFAPCFRSVVWDNPGSTHLSVYSSSELNMPPRTITWLIVAFWLTTTGWLFWKELRPFLDTTSPPFHIDLVDEVQQKVPIRWNVYLEGKAPGILFSEANLRPFQAQSWVEYQEKDDSFSFHFKTTSGTPLELDLLLLRRLDSSYRITREGQLLSMESNFVVDLIRPLELANIGTHLTGEVRNGEFHSRVHLSLPPAIAGIVGTAAKEQTLPTVPVKQRGSVLLPLHPVNKITGIFPGQTWHIPLVNPFIDVARQMSPIPLSQEEIQSDLLARVLPDLKQLPDYPHPMPCLVIEYDDEKTRPRTWVHATTGQVLRQEATILDGRRLIMQRESLPSAEMP